MGLVDFRKEKRWAIPYKVQFIRIQEDTTQEIFEEQLKNPVKHNIQESYIQSRSSWAFLVNLEDQKNSFPVLDQLLAKIEDPFTLSGYYCGNQKMIIPLYSTNPTIKRKTARSRPRVAILADWLRKGDVLMIYPLLQDFILKYRRRGIQTDIITNFEVASLIEQLIDHSNVFQIIESQYTKEILKKSQNYLKVYPLRYRLNSGPSKHVIELCSISLGLKEGLDLGKWRLKKLVSLPHDISDNLHKLQARFQYIIGIQYHTSDLRRSWPKENVKKLQALCEENGIGLLNLTPVEEIPPVTADFSQLSVEQLITLITHLDMVVSIDSLCAHIAGIMGVPNITIWGRSYPHLQFPDGLKSYVSFRSISMNYSLVSKDTRSESIHAEIVFSRIKDILNGSIELQENTITFENGLSKDGIEWVN